MIPKPLKIEFVSTPFVMEMHVRTTRLWETENWWSVANYLQRQLRKKGQVLNYKSLNCDAVVDKGKYTMLLITGKYFECPESSPFFDYLKNQEIKLGTISFTFPHGMENIQKALDNPTNLG